MVITPIRILIFTEGTIIMHKSAVGHKREEIIDQVEKKLGSVHDYGSYIPIGDAVRKIKRWKDQGVVISYLTSRRVPDEVKQIKAVIKKHGFPEGQLLFRKKDESYKDIAERIIPDVLIEDDCESIGGTGEMTITNIRSEIKMRIKSIAVKEFGGIDFLPDNITDLVQMH